jgi:hypothetical protein
MDERERMAAELEEVKKVNSTDMPKPKEVKSNIYSKINAIQSDMQGYLKKDVIISNYKGISHDAVTAHIRAAMIKHGVVSFPSMEHCEIATFQDKRKNNVTRCIATVHVTYVDCDNPESTHTIKSVGIGDDYGDKASGKAYSYATKNAQLKVFNLETGENDESRVEVQAPETTVDVSEAKNIRDLLTSNNKQESNLIVYINGQYNMELTAIEEIPKRLYPGIMKMFGRKQ